MNIYKKNIADIRKKIGNRQKKKIVFVSGNFNILHPGHLRLLRFAKECGDILIVGVYADSLERGAVIKEEQRLEALESTTWVDYAFIINDEPAFFIKGLRPAIVVKGKEHEDTINPERDAVASYGGKLLFCSGDVTFSSIELLKKEFSQLNFSTITKPLDFSKRHNFKIRDLIDIIKRISKLKIVVIGDLIVDEYTTCDPIGMSREDPTIVVSPIMTEKFIGGAGIVAAHAKGLGANVEFFSVVGKDDIAKFAKNKLKEYEVTSHLYLDESRPTIHKKRYRAEGKTLLRVSNLRQHAINSELQNNIFKDLGKKLKNSNLLVFSDFNYGCLPQELVNKIIKYCQKHNIMMVADSQSSSQTGDISRFKGMKLITPTEHEARLAVRDVDLGLVVLAEALRKKSDAENVLVTLGEEGILIHAADDQKEWQTDKLPAFNSLPKDVAGAGDLFLITAAMALALDVDIWISSYLGSVASACQVGRIGNIPLTRELIIQELNA